MARNEHGLTPQMERYAQALAVGDRSQADCYREAYPTCKTWKPETVHESASRLAGDRKVSARVNALKAVMAERAELNGSEILREIRKLAHSDIGSVMHADGRVKLPHELDPATRAAVKGFKIDDLGRIEYQFWDKNAALEKAMKHLGLYEKDNKQQGGGLQALRDLLLGNVVKPEPSAALPDDDSA